MKTINIEELKKIQRYSNLKIIRDEINSKWVKEKIRKHLERNPHLKYSIEQVKEIVLSDDLVASFFIKDPGRQNIGENTISNLVSSIDLIKSFINHPSNVSLFVVNGKITSKRKEGIKSIDFEWTTNEKKVYATQKYTVGTGGAQDNQYNDVRIFLQNCIGNVEHFFVAIVDGNYYTERKINDLRNEFERDNIKITGVNNLRDVLLNV